MNWQHIEAMLRGVGLFKWAVLNGEHLVTNGDFAVRRGLLTRPVCTGEAYAPLAKLWREYSTRLGAYAQVGEVLKFDRGFYRQIGEEWISEAYYRCFSDAKWINGPKRCLIPCVNGSLMALVMPVAMTGTSSGKTVAPIPDEDVFSYFAGERNDWYLINSAKISSEIEELLEFIETHQKKIVDAEHEISSAHREIEGLERLARERGLVAQSGPLSTISPEPLHKHEKER